MFYSANLLRTSAQEDTASQIALRDCSKEVREMTGYMTFSAWGKKNVVEYQKITANHKNRHLELMILALLVWEDARA